MATLLVAAVGAVIGSVAIPAGILGVSGAAIGWGIGSIIGNYAFNKPPDQFGARLNDLRVTGTEYGQPIPLVMNRARVPGQIIWCSEKREIATTQKVGKGGGGGKVTTYTYEIDIMYMLAIPLLGDGFNSLRRIWSNGELVWDMSTVKDGVWSDIQFRPAGTIFPDPVYESYVGVGNAPLHNYADCVRISSLQLGQQGVVPNLTFELVNPYLEGVG